MRPSTVPAADCPVAPAARAGTYARALHRACIVLGGIDSLAAHLQVSESALQSWLNGVEDPPLQVFLAAVEVLLLHASPAGRA